MGFWKNIKEIFWSSSPVDHDEEYQRKFHIWAFGSNKRLSQLEMIRNWNCIHGDKMILGGECDLDAEMRECLYDIYDDHLNKIQSALKNEAM